MKPLLIFDSNYICHYKKFAMRNLSYKDQKTGIIYGFLQSVLKYAKQFDTNRFVFAWQNGYEADDVIASLVYKYKEKEEKIVIIANDHDLYQLLDDNVVLCNPANNEVYDVDALVLDWKVHPTEWGQAMGIAGCTTDTVEGVPKIGMKTAIKFIYGELSKSTKAWSAIDQAHKLGWVDKTRKLVVLPLAGTKDFPLQPERLNYYRFADICDWYNMQSFLKKKKLDDWIHYLQLRSGAKDEIDRG
jgi:5'-3' exonuclease